MPGDLNAKKSWHPGLLKNQAKVKAKEQEALAARKKQAERQTLINHQREIEDLKGLQGGPVPKLAWMYEQTDKSEPKDNAYLLGQRPRDRAVLHRQETKVNDEKKAREQKRKESADPMAALKPKGSRGARSGGVSKQKR